MKSLIVKQAEKFLREQKNHKRWLAVFLCLAVVVATGTTAALKYKGIAVTTDNEEMHVHTDECYEEQKVLICGLEEGEGSEGSGHVHTDACYAITEGGTELTCGMEEHTHGDGCYTTTEGTTELTCGMEENPEEEGGHVHDDSCYTTSGGGSELTCGMEEHTHGEGCYTTTEGTKELICGMEEGEGSEGSGHVHDDSCYKIEKVLICEEKTEEDIEEEDTEEEPEEDAEEEPKEEEYTSGTLSARGNDYEVIVSYDEEAKIPEEAELKVEEIEAGSDAYQECYDQMLEALPEGWDEEDQEIAFARFFDITILVDGEEIEPETGATVQIKYDDAALEEEQEQGGFAVHFPRNGGTEIIDAEISGGKDFTFNQNSFSVTGTVSVISGDPKEGELSATGEGYTVTVTYDKDSGIDKNCELVVTEIGEGRKDGSGDGSFQECLNSSESAVKGIADNSEDKEFDVSGRVLELSIEKDGEAVDTNEVSVEIAVEYASPVISEAPGIAALVLDAEDVLYEEELEEGDEVSELSAQTMMSFSASRNTVAALMASETEEDWGNYSLSGNGVSRAAGTHTDVSGFLTSKGKNDWQIVEGGYAGDKKDGNDKVRVQKNVIPTDTENEFLVYLSIDVKTMISEQIDLAGFGALTNNSAKNPGDSVPISSTVNVSIGGNQRMATLTLLDPEGKLIEGCENLNFSWDTSNNFTLVYRINGNAYCIQSGIKAGNDYKIRLPKNVYDEIKKQHKETSILTMVTDNMGSCIICESVLGGDYESYTISDNKKTLTWKPSVNPKCGIEDIGNGEFWELNAAQLVYKVKLDVTADGFPSCAEHMGKEDKTCATPVNDGATLTYKGGSIPFPVPTVRGLLYDISLKKVDKDDENVVLSGAEFTLTGESIKEPIVVESNPEGIVRFNNLPWGTYTITETQAPEGYQAVPEGGRTLSAVTVCHTTDPDLLEQDVNPYQANKIYKGGASGDITQTGNNIVVTNEKIPPIKLVKVWNDDNNIRGLRPDSVTYKIEYKVGNEFVAVPSVTDKESGNVIIGQDGRVTLTKDAVVVEEGKPDRWEVIVDNLPESDEYQVTEILPDDSSYQIKIPEGVTASDKDKAVCTSETVTIKGKEKQINVYTITNELQKTEIQLLKIEEGSDPEKPLAGAKFEIWVKTKEAYEDEDPKQSPWGNEDPDAAAWNEETDQRGLIFDGRLVYGEYWLEEIEPPENYIEKEHPYVLTVGQDGVTISYNGEGLLDLVTSGDGGKYVVKIPNKTEEKAVTIWKRETGTENVLLPGAMFKVYYTKDSTVDLTWDTAWEAEGAEGIETWRSADGGQIVDNDEKPIEKLKVGRYMIKEMKAPDGYNLPADPMVITVNIDGGIFIDKNGSVDQKGDKIYIENSAGLMLPETGGPGVAVYTLGGFALIAAALMYGFSMRRKRWKGGHAR